MESLRKWFCKPKRDDKSLLAQFFFADEALNMIASELDSFDGRKDPERCTSLVNLLRQSQDRVLIITNAIMDVLIPNERANRDFRVKFPEDVLQENLAGQLWFGAECLAAGSSIMHREAESAAMRPLAKALTKSLENVRNLLREACLRNNTPNGPLRLPNNEFISESLKIFDRLFAEFELCYVSAMVPVKTTQEYELQELIGVLFSETLQRALKMKLLTQDQVDDYDPALMFTIPRLAIVSGLLIYPNGPLCIDKPVDKMSEMFRPFKTLLQTIRELLWTLNKRELYMLEKLLCDNEQISDVRAFSEISNGNGDLDDFVNRFYNDYPLCKDFISSFYTVTVNESDHSVDYANEASDIAFLAETAEKRLRPNADSLFPDYETISDSSLPPNVVSADVPVLEPVPDLVKSSDTENTALGSSDIDSYNNTLMDLVDSREFVSSENAPPPLEEILSNVIASTNYFTNEETDSNSDPVKFERQSSDNIEIPSTSGYLLVNSVTHDSIARIQSAPERVSERLESLPDRDCMETISEATATLSNLLLNGKQDKDGGVSGYEYQKPEEMKEDCVYCEEIKKETAQSGPKNAKCLDSPIDSGISTENTSLDRSPSLDLVPNENTRKEGGGSLGILNARRGITKDNFKSNDANILSSNDENVTPSVTVTSVIPCQCNVEDSTVKNIEINYSEPTVAKNEDACDKLTVCIGSGDSDNSRTSVCKKSGDISPSTSKKCDNLSPHLRRRMNLTPGHRKRTHQRPTNFSEKSALAPEDTVSVCSSETSSFKSECADDEEIALAMQAAEIANRNEIRAKFSSSEDLVHRLFVCIAGVADQLQTNFASDLRNILKSVFLMNASDSNPEPAVSPLTDSINDTMEYRALESDTVRTDEFSIDPNILAQEALFDSNVYIRMSANDHDQMCDDDGAEYVDDDVATDAEIPAAEPSLEETSQRTGNRYRTATERTNDAPPIWIPDVEAPKCMSCEANFTVVKRRHHCRNCGKVFCARCSSNSVPLPKYGHNKPVRVCNRCFMYNLTPFTL